MGFEVLACVRFRLQWICLPVALYHVSSGTLQFFAFVRLTDFLVTSSHRLLKNLQIRSICIIDSRTILLQFLGYNRLCCCYKSPCAFFSTTVIFRHGKRKVSVWNQLIQVYFRFYVRPGFSLEVQHLTYLLSVKSNCQTGCKQPNLCQKSTWAVHTGSSSRDKSRLVTACVLALTDGLSCSAVFSVVNWSFFLPRWLIVTFGWNCRFPAAVPSSDISSFLFRLPDFSRNRHAVSIRFYRLTFGAPIGERAIKIRRQNQSF